MSQAPRRTEAHSKAGTDEASCLQYQPATLTVRSRLQPQPALLEQVSEQGFRLRGRHQPRENPLREGERR